MMTHCTKKPYECKFQGCDKSYCDARSLRRHLENHHQQLLDSSIGSGGESVLTPGASSDGGQLNIFRFDLSPYGQSYQGGGDYLLHSNEHSPGQQQLSPTSPATSSASPTGGAASQKAVWTAGYNPLE